MSVLNHKYKASTLVETIIAMVILLFVFSAGITVFHKVMQSSVNLQKVKAQQMAHQIIEDCAKEKTFFDATVVGDDFTSIKKVESSTWGANLYKVSVMVLGPKKDTLSLQKKIFYAED